MAMGNKDIKTKYVEYYIHLADAFDCFILSSARKVFWDVVFKRCVCVGGGLPAEEDGQERCHRDFIPPPWSLIVAWG